MSTRGSFFKQAFEEYKVTRQVSTGNGAMYVSCVEFDGRVPGFFVREELGYDGPCGTRLYQMIPQDRLEYRHQRMARGGGGADVHDVPVAPVKAQRETPASRRAKLEQLEMRARAGQYAA